MDVVLINPPSIDYPSTSGPQEGLIPPLGLGFIGTVLRKAGHSAELIDAEAMRYGFVQTSEKVLAKRPRIVGLTVLAPVLPAVAQIASQLKHEDPSITIIVGGSETTAEPRLLLEHYPQFDLAIVGEGEEAALRATEAILSGHEDELHRISGLAYRKQHEVAQNPVALQPLDIDALPMLDRTLFAFDPHHKSRSVESFMISSRGCPASCSFCSIPRTWQHVVRFRDPVLVLEEMIRLHDEFGVDDFHFVDDAFTAARERAIRLCSVLDQSDLGVAWRCTTRADLVDDRLLEQMKASGCYMITFGVETGDEILRGAINKRITTKAAYSAVQAAKQKGLLVKLMFMLGFPGETLGQMQRTIALAVELDPDFAYFCPVKAYPGTELYNSAIARYNRSELMSFGRLEFQRDGFSTSEFEIYKELIDSGFDVAQYFKYNEYHDRVVLAETDLDGFLDMVALAYRKFYLRPEYLRKWRSQVIQSVYR
jgi:anaerobic magnesium-protoporphyrin IX monomethyl ester cyclase